MPRYGVNINVQQSRFLPISCNLLIPSFVSFEANSLIFNLILIEAKVYLCFYTNKIEDIYLMN